MRPDLPWNVAGISTEAREAARAAARREGLSVGEWLTRRIVSGLSDMNDHRTDWTPNYRAEYRPEPERQRRDSEAMLDRVSKSEAETAEVYRRIEEQLRAMARRLDSSERSQTESNRVMSKAAVEMNIAAREQSQAFDQLGAHVTNLADRLDRVEGREGNDGMREAVKALHLGLSRLADQLTQTANQSAGQISNLANNLESVAGRVSQSRQDALSAAQTLEERLATIDERVHKLETTTQANAGSIDHALEAIEAQKRAPSPMDAIARLEDSVRRLEERGPDAGLERRLSGIERSLSDVKDRVAEQDKPNPLEENLRKLMQRLETLETAQREAAVELRKIAAEKSVEELPPQPEMPPQVVPFTPPPAAVQPQAAAAFGPLNEPPPYADLPPFVAPQAAAATATMPPVADPLPNYELPPPPTAGYTAAFVPAGMAAEAPSTVESYLAAARRSARAAAQQEAERSGSIGGLRWGAAKTSEEKPKRTRPLFLVGLVALVAIVLIAGAILSRQAANMGAHPNFANKPAIVAAKTTPPPQTAPDLHASTQEPVSAPVPTAVKPQPATGVAAPKPGPQLAAIQPGAVKPAAVPPQQARPAAPLDRLTQAANTGNAKAQLIVGLKYLDGDGIPANDGEAIKWLSKAAEAGEPVAQYRLGTLYERGRGVPADGAKALRWYQAAANQGSRKAMHNLAVAYAEGAGVKRDYAEASRWFLKAANLGLSDSQFNLAVLYERGLGVPQNLVDAYKWYAIAAAQGDAESKSRISAIASQLDNEARGAAQHAADTFRPVQLNARANVAPTVADVTRG